MAQAETLRNTLIEEIRDLYHAEKQLTKALPKLAKAASNNELRAAFEAHLDETEEHVARLEQAFDLLDEKPRAKTCAGMLGIIEESAELISEHDRGVVLDAGLVAAAQRAEHYEIAAYGTVMAWAKTLGLDEIATLLAQTLDEEKAADEKLSSLAESELNAEAAAEELLADEGESTLVGARRSATPRNGAPRKRR